VWGNLRLHNLESPLLFINFQQLYIIPAIRVSNLQFICFLKIWIIFVNQCRIHIECVIVIENRIYIKVEFTRKKCKTAILLYCFHTAGVLHIFMLYNLCGPGTSFYRKSKINVKRKPNNWPMIISHRLYAFQFTNDDFPL